MRAHSVRGAVYPPARNTPGKATAERNAFFPRASKPAAQPQLSALTSRGVRETTAIAAAPGRLLPPKAPGPTAAEPALLQAAKGSHTIGSQRVRHGYAFSCNSERRRPAAASCSPRRSDRRARSRLAEPTGPGAASRPPSPPAGPGWGRYRPNSVPPGRGFHSCRWWACWHPSDAASKALKYISAVMHVDTHRL